MSNGFNEWIMIPCGIKSSILMHGWYMSWIVMVQTCQIPGQDSVISTESAPDQSVHLSATIAFTSSVLQNTARCISKFEARTLQVESGTWIRNLQGGWSLKLNWFPSSKASNPSKVLSDIFPTSAQGKNHQVIVTSKVGMFQNEQFQKWQRVSEPLPVVVINHPPSDGPQHHHTSFSIVSHRHEAKKWLWLWRYVDLGTQNHFLWKFIILFTINLAKKYREVSEDDPQISAIFPSRCQCLHPSFVGLLQHRALETPPASTESCPCRKWESHHPESGMARQEPSSMNLCRNLGTPSRAARTSLISRALLPSTSSSSTSLSPDTAEYTEHIAALSWNKKSDDVKPITFGGLKSQIPNVMCMYVYIYIYY